MKVEPITEADIAADRFVERETLAMLLTYPEVARRVRFAPHKQLYEQIMDAAAALKTYHPAYINTDIVLEHVGHRALERFPTATERAMRRMSRYLQSA